MTSCIYQIVNKITGKRYIGSASDYAKRCHAHRKKLTLGTHHSPKLQNSWDKHGSDNFVFSIIEIVNDKTKLTEREQYWIDVYRASEDGYNINPIAGSSRGIARGPRPPEVIEKIREAQKGRPLSEAHKAALRAADNSGMKGKTRSEAFKRRMSEVHKGKTLSEETRRKISISRQAYENDLKDKLSNPSKS